MSEPAHDSAVSAVRARIDVLEQPSEAARFAVWLRFLEYGGSVDYFAFGAYLDEALCADPLTMSVLTHVVWELEHFGLRG